MSVLPKNTVLGKLEIVEIYEYYDQPLLFTCKNASEQIFLVVLEEEEEDFDVWLYASMSPVRFAQVRSGVVDLHSAFTLAEDGFVFQIRLYHDGETSADVSAISVEHLQPDQLPEAGEKLNLQTVTLEQKRITVQRRAQQLLREYVEIALEFPNQKRNEAPIAALGEIMGSIQETLISLGHTISDLHSESKNPSRDLISRMELSLIDVSAGSFTLEMASSENADMFGDTLLGDALEELARLISTGSDEDELERLFSAYKSTVPKDYLKLLRTIRGSRIDRANVRWSSVNGRSGESALLSPVVISTIDAIENMIINETTMLTVSGKLTGALQHREFEIETYDGRVYSGKFDNEALTVDDLEIINNAQLGRRYTARLRENTSRYVATDEIRRKYFLLGIEEDEF